MDRNLHSTNSSSHIIESFAFGGDIVFRTRDGEYLRNSNGSTTQVAPGYTMKGAKCCYYEGYVYPGSKPSRKR